MHPRSTPPRWENARWGPRADCVAPLSNIPDIAPHRAQDARWGPRSAVVAPLRRGPHGADCAPWGGTAGRLAALGATPGSHHGLRVVHDPTGRRRAAASISIRIRGSASPAVIIVAASLTVPPL